MVRFESNPFAVRTQKTEAYENASYSLVNKLLITMTFRVAIGALLTAVNKRLCFEKGISNAVLLEPCERAAFSLTKTDGSESEAV